MKESPVKPKMIFSPADFVRIMLKHVGGGSSNEQVRNSIILKWYDSRLWKTIFV